LPYDASLEVQTDSGSAQITATNMFKGAVSYNVLQYLRLR
jgi:hypothetical protein